MTDGPLFPLPRGGDADSSTQSSYPQLDEGTYPPMGGPPGRPRAPSGAPRFRGGIPPMVGIGIGVAVALVVVAAGIAFGMTRSGNEQPSATAPNTTTPYATPGGDGSGGGGSQTRRNEAAAVPPPLVQTPDTFGETCGSGFQLPNKTGWATHSGRGSSETSCFFAHSVLEAYWDQYASSSGDTRVVTARGTVPCPSTGGECSGDQFVMRCAEYGADTWITCTGGKNARVYLY